MKTQIQQSGHRFKNISMEAFFYLIEIDKMQNNIGRIRLLAFRKIIPIFMTTYYSEIAGQAK